MKYKKKFKKSLVNKFKKSPVNDLGKGSKKIAFLDMGFDIVNFDLLNSDWAGCDDMDFEENFNEVLFNA